MPPRRRFLRDLTEEVVTEVRLLPPVQAELARHGAEREGWVVAASLGSGPGRAMGRACPTRALHHDRPRTPKVKAIITRRFRVPGAVRLRGRSQQGRGPLETSFGGNRGRAF